MSVENEENTPQENVAPTGLQGETQGEPQGEPRRSSLQNVLSIEHQFQHLLFRIVSLIPKSWIPALLYGYAVVSEGLERMFHQARRTASAVAQSLETSPLLFIQGTHFVGVKASGTIDPVFARHEAVWTYHPETSTFVERGAEEKRPVRFPWLSAELWMESLMVSDLTDWLEKVRIQSHGPQCPPDVLIQAWAYEHHRSLGNLAQYRIQVMTDEAEEETIPVRPI